MNRRNFITRLTGTLAAVFGCANLRSGGQVATVATGRAVVGTLPVTPETIHMLMPPEHHAEFFKAMNDYVNHIDRRPGLGDLLLRRGYKRGDA